MTSRPDLFWGLIASMWIGNGMLLLLNLPLIGIWVKLLQVPYRLLFPIIMTMMGIGIYSLNNSGTDVLLMAFFGFVGYVLLEARMLVPAADSRDGAGAADGGEPAALAAPVGRRRDGLLHAADQLRLHGGDGGAAAVLHAAGVQADNARLIVMKSRSAAAGRRNGVRARCATLPSFQTMLEHRRMNRATLFIAATLASFAAADCRSQIAPYPSRLVRLINPVAPGGNQDIVARAYAGS